MTYTEILQYDPSIDGLDRRNGEREDRHMAILSLCVIHFPARSIIFFITEYVNYHQCTCAKSMFKNICALDCFSLSP